MKHGVAWLFVLAGLLGAGGGWLFNHVMWPDDPAPEPVYAATPQALVGQVRPAFRLGRIDGQWVSASDFDGQVLLLNFWATWCAPCREEMPMLNQLHNTYAEAGLNVVGIALDDVEQARTFVAETGVNYPILVGMADVMETGRQYGNATGLLPYSVLVDRAGVVRWTKLGPVTEDEVLRQFEPLL